MLAVGMASHKYGVPNRPIGIGTVPRGYVQVLDPDPRAPEATRHGVVVYNRPLTSEEVESYQLRPWMSPGAVVATVVRRMLPNREEYLEAAEDYPAALVQFVGGELARLRAYTHGTREDLAPRVLVALRQARGLSGAFESVFS